MNSLTMALSVRLYLNLISSSVTNASRINVRIVFFWIELSGRQSDEDIFGAAGKIRKVFHHLPEEICDSYHQEREKEKCVSLWKGDDVRIHFHYHCTGDRLIFLIYGKTKIAILGIFTDVFSCSVRLFLALFNKHRENKEHSLMFSLSLGALRQVTRI